MMDRAIFSSDVHNFLELSLNGPRQGKSRYINRASILTLFVLIT